MPYVRVPSLSLRLLTAVLIATPLALTAQQSAPLTIESTKEVGQIEVGSPYIGVEIHKSFPLLNRISFYYPVANSIDISEDYWKRDKFRIMSVGLKVGDARKRLVKQQVYKVSQTPYSVSFSGTDAESRVRISYEFTRNQPALVITCQITNASGGEKEYEVYTKLITSLRTSHTYKVVDGAYTGFQDKGSIIRANYPFIETGNAQVFVMNAGLVPSSFTTAAEKGFENLDDWWLANESPLPAKLIPKEKPASPVAAFIYRTRLQPDSSMTIVQIVGSSLISEAETKTDALSGNYRNAIDEYRKYIEGEALDKQVITTGDKDVDFTSRWSKAVLATNRHYLKNRIVPMPAPAEYNFFFTHDALLTDLAAVNFDLPRVKADLEYIISLADSNRTIPHAYYWKDSAYRTEFAGRENWNHFWFVLASARYLRHSGDTAFAEKLYPYVERSVTMALENKGKDDLMWSARPDWWDIGNTFGPRAYMTILAVRGLREFNYISMVLHKNSRELKTRENLADRMKARLVDLLWDDKLNYLINYYGDGKEDRHIYMGSLLASHFNLLDEEKSTKLMTTAKTQLLDDKLGIYTVYPMDMNLLGDYMKFAGDEAGAPYHYINGGIWPHGNAWYALGLINNGLNADAFDFIKRTMTLNGIIHSPNGQPALYEYRISDKSDSAAYGKIDKPQFLWAGGWYFYTLYNLFGLRENEWNVSFSPFMPATMNSVHLTVTIRGVPVGIDIRGKGTGLSSISFDGKELPSSVVPADMEDVKKIVLTLGKPRTPYLNAANALVITPVYDTATRTLTFDLETFEGHSVEVQVVSPTSTRSVNINGSRVSSGITEVNKLGTYRITLRHVSGSRRNHYSIQVK